MTPRRSVPEVDEARRIFSRLRRSDWADPTVSFQEVMDGLAACRPLPSVLAKDRVLGGYIVQMTQEEARLGRELVALARAPYLAEPWPETPATPLDRLEQDFARTTGRSLALHLRWDNRSDGGMWLFDITLDGALVGGRDLGGLEEGPEARLADVADKLCEGWLHEEVWGGWPMCRRHPRRPMWAHVSQAGTASWGCEADPADVVAIGALEGHTAS